MEFTLTVDLEKLDGDHAHELARILRYWAGAFKDADLEPNSTMNIYDVHYKKVGRWSVAESSGAPVDAEPASPVIPETAAPAPKPELPEVPGKPDQA